MKNVDYFMKGLRNNQALLAKVFSKEEVGYFKPDGYLNEYESDLWKKLTKRLNEYVPYTGADLPIGRFMWVTSELCVLQFRVKKGSKKYWFLIKEGFEEGN